MNNACAGVAPSCPRHCRKIAGSGLASRNCAEQNTRSSNSGNNGGQIAGRWSRSSRLLLVRNATLGWRARRGAGASHAASAALDARPAAVQRPESGAVGQGGGTSVDRGWRGIIKKKKRRNNNKI